MVRSEGLQGKFSKLCATWTKLTFKNAQLSALSNDITKYSNLGLPDAFWMKRVGGSAPKSRAGARRVTRGGAGSIFGGSAPDFSLITPLQREKIAEFRNFHKIENVSIGLIGQRRG